MSILILLRHGQSEWNEKNLFTGWYDCDLTQKGVKEAEFAGKLLLEADLSPKQIYTSLQRRAIKTAEIVMSSFKDEKISLHKKWRLNERHYGDLTGLNKTLAQEKFGKEKLQNWRRGFNTPPPPIREENPFNPNKDLQYSHLSAKNIPKTECLADVVARLIPYWETTIIPALETKEVILISAHGNSLRALCKHLDNINNDEISKLNIPTGMPFIYELNEKFKPKIKKPVLERALDPNLAKEAAEAVMKQADLNL